MEDTSQSNHGSEVKKAFLSTYKGSSLKVYALEESTTLGRSPTNKIRLSDAHISTQHLRIDLTHRGVFLKDLQSASGTFVNHTRVISCYLNEGDRIRVGNNSFIFTHGKNQSEEEWKPLMSQNRRWQRQLSKLPQISGSDFTVLITGPSGAGKEMIAQFIHEHSCRKDMPIININCSALSESLIESELFGHKKGSFTGADRDRLGAFQAAKGGTIFLDEIGDLPMSLQPKLLRALENKEIKPVGSDEIYPTNVRVIAATHQNLKNSVIQKKFRADLFYRLNVLSVQVPPLKDRLEDFETLLYKFAKGLNVRFSHGAIEKLKQHSWLGNIRELKNSIARAQTIYGRNIIRDKDVGPLVDTMSVEPTHGQSLYEIEKQIICGRLADNMGNKKKTAEDLGIPKSTLYDRIKAYGVDASQWAQKEDLSAL